MAWVWLRACRFVVRFGQWRPCCRPRTMRRCWRTLAGRCISCPTVTKTGCRCVRARAHARACVCNHVLVQPQSAYTSPSVRVWLQCTPVAAAPTLTSPPGRVNQAVVESGCVARLVQLAGEASVSVSACRRSHVDAHAASLRHRSQPAPVPARSCRCLLPSVWATC